MKPWERYQNAEAKPWEKYQKHDAPIDGDFSFGEMVSNIPGSAAKVAGDLYTAVRHPVRTAKGLGALASGIVDKSAEELIQALPDDYVSGINQLNNWLRAKGLPLAELPEERPKDIRFDDSATAEQLGGFIMDRYGSWDAFKQTLERDPVGVLTDAAAVVSGVGTATGSRMMTRAGAALEPLNAITKPTKYLAGKVIPKRLPPAMYERSAKFSTTLSQGDRSKLTKTALEHNIPPTYKGAARLQSKIDALDNAIDGLIANSDSSGKMIPKGAIFKHLGALRKQKGGPLIEGAADLKAIDDIAREFHRHLSAIKVDSFTPGQLQAIKRDIYNKINFDAKYLRGTPIKESTYKALARGAKDAIEKEVPGIGEANRTMGDLLDLQPHLQRAANRIEHNNVIPLNAPVNILAGSTAGPAGATAGVLASILEAAKPRALAALKLYNMQKMTPIDILNNRPLMAQARLAAILAGRQEATNTNQ